MDNIACSQKQNCQKVCEQETKITKMSTDELATKGVLCFCTTKILGFLTILLAFLIGAILGGIFSNIVLSNLAVLIASAILLLIGITALLIFKKCSCCPKQSCHY